MRKSKTYSEQSQYVKGNKIWLELSDDQEIIVSPQARETLAFHGVNEEKFIQKMKELLRECFTNLSEHAGFTFLFHTLSVSKSALYWSNEEDKTPYIKIEIYDCHGTKKKEEKTK